MLGQVSSFSVLECCQELLIINISRFYSSVVFLSIASLSCKDNRVTNQQHGVFPVPKEIDYRSGSLCLSDTIAVTFTDASLRALSLLLRDELRTLENLAVDVSRTRPGELELVIDSSMQQESYTLVADDHIVIKGRDYNSVAMGTATLLQILATNKNRCIPRMEIRDRPDSYWRSLLIDPARRPHDIETIKNVVRLCRWYKIRYLQLHLTDDQFFTFPSQAFPGLPTKAFHYTLDELNDLVEFAHVHGVELVPELEVPGHAHHLVTKLPHIFGFDDPSLNRNTINMARDEVYAALDTLVSEIAEVFKYSRYIHMGGDEANFKGMEDNAQVNRWMQEHNLTDIDELFWHFINSTNAIIKKHGKSTIVWEGFSKEGNATVDKDITVMAWETMYQMPQHLLDGGFRIVNVSWVPNYVVNDRKWSPLDIYHWNIYRWENWVPHIPSYKPFQIDRHANVIGGGMASWEQDAFEEISSLRLRVPAMSERLWNHESKMSDSVFSSTLLTVDSAFSSYLSPVRIESLGRTYPYIQDGRYNEETWFHDSLRVTLDTRDGLDIRYTLDNSKVSSQSEKYQSVLVLRKGGNVRYRAFAGDIAVGAEMFNYYSLRPLAADFAGNFPVPPDSIWATLTNKIIGYRHTLTVSLTALRPGIIRYVIGDRNVTASSSEYTKPLTFAAREITLVRAALFADGVQVGEAWEQRFKGE